MMPQPTSNQLPTIDDYPDADLVIYDGKCVFCTNGVRQLRRLDGRNRLAFLSLHDPQVPMLAPELTHAQMMEQMFVIPRSDSSQHYGGAAAIRYLSRRLPKLWITAPLLHIPFSLPVWQWLYTQVAKRRYRIANKNGNCDDEGTCEVHFRK
jgi:predicted DCC family thiol-disulfide oxidoreductase YuxK